MDINNIEEIRYKGNTISIVLDIGFEDDKRNRWELVEPRAVVEYDNGLVSSIDLIDNGMKVHEFEFQDNEINQIEKYINNENIIK